MLASPVTNRYLNLCILYLLMKNTARNRTINFDCLLTKEIEFHRNLIGGAIIIVDIQQNRKRFQPFLKHLIKFIVREYPLLFYLVDLYNKHKYIYIYIARSIQVNFLGNKTSYESPYCRLCHQLRNTLDVKMSYFKLHSTHIPVNWNRHSLR